MLNASGNRSDPKRRNVFAVGADPQTLRMLPLVIGMGWYKKLAYVFDPFVNAINANDRSSLITD